PPKVLPNVGPGFIPPLDPTRTLQDMRLTLQMARVAAHEGARVPGNRLGKPQETVFYPTQKAAHQEGVTFGMYASRATSRAPAANVVLIETYNNEVPSDFSSKSKQTRRVQELNAFVRAITQVFLR